MPQIEFIRLHQAAPAKPPWGERCNGCGACCAAEPCPLSRLLLGHRSGPCPALVWVDARSNYVCGLAHAPSRYLSWWPSSWNGIGARLARRWIAAGTGCDFDADMEP
jgi:hypothetical protein